MPPTESAMRHVPGFDPGWRGYECLYLPSPLLCIDRGHGLHLFGDMVNTLPCMASPQKEERHALERGVDHVSTSRIHAVSPAAGGLPPRSLSPVRDQPHHRL